MKKKVSCGCGKGPGLELQDLSQSREPWIVGSVPVQGRSVPVVSTRLDRQDEWGGVKVRWNIGRDRYTVPLVSMRLARQRRSPWCLSRQTTN